MAKPKLTTLLPNENYLIARSLTKKSVSFRECNIVVLRSVLLQLEVESTWIS